MKNNNRILKKAPLKYSGNIETDGIKDEEEAKDFKGGFKSINNGKDEATNQLCREGLTDIFYDTIMEVNSLKNPDKICNVGLIEAIITQVEENAKTFLEEFREDHGRLRVPMQGEVTLVNSGVYYSMPDLNYSETNGAVTFKWEEDGVKVEVNRIMSDYLQLTGIDVSEVEAQKISLNLQPVNPSHPIKTPLEFINRDVVGVLYDKDSAIGDTQPIVRKEFADLLYDIIEKVDNLTGVLLNERLDVIRISNPNGHLELVPEYNKHNIMYLAYAHPIVKAIRYIILQSEDNISNVTFHDVGKYLNKDDAKELYKFFEELNQNLLIDHRIIVNGTLEEEILQEETPAEETSNEYEDSAFDLDVDMDETEEGNIE